MPQFVRDPLSVQFSGAAEAAISRLLEQPWATRSYTVTSPPGDSEDAGGLTETERALQRALYYALNSTFGSKSAQNPDWSLMRGWGPPIESRRLLVFRGERKRTLWLTIIPKSAAQIAAARRPPATLWRDNAELQSGGLGSVKQRF